MDIVTGAKRPGMKLGRAKERAPEQEAGWRAFSHRRELGEMGGREADADLSVLYEGVRPC